jgi:hypothetical protein
MRSTVAVYTALFGGYDVLQEPVAETTCDFICFTDDPSLRSRTWKIVHLPLTMEPALMNRHVKLHPHLYLAGYQTSIYVDANLRVRRDPASLVDTYLAARPFAAPRHPVRNCVYDEIQQCISTGKTDARSGHAQADRYRREGYPAGNGLSENRVLIRRHHDPTVTSLMDAWWTELMAGVKRDQACLQVVCWRQRFELQFMDEDILCGRHFLYRPHKHERPVIRAKIHALIALKTLSRMREQMVAAFYSRRAESR